MSFWTELRMPTERERLVGFYDLAGYMRHAEKTEPQGQRPPLISRGSPHDGRPHLQGLGLPLALRPYRPHERHVVRRQVRRGHLEPVRNLLAGDIVEKSVRFIHEMFNAETGVLAAVCELTGVHMDRTARRVLPFPAALRGR
jgi:hypothetical protein